MRKKINTNIIVLLLSIAFIGIIATQVLLVNGILDLRKKQFDEDVRQILIEIKNDFSPFKKFEHSLDLISSKSDSVLLKIDNNLNFPLNILMNDDSKLFDKLLREKLLRYGINNKYYYIVLDNFEDIKLSNINKDNELLIHLLESEYKIKFNSLDFIYENNLYIYFPDKIELLFNQLWILLLIILLFLSIVIYSFIVSIKIIKEQNTISILKTDFINNVTHELKTPISTIKLACEALKNNDIDDETGISFINIIDDENNRLDNLVNTVLKTSIIERGNIEFNKQYINIKNIIENVVTSFKLKILQINGKFVLTDITDCELFVDYEHIYNTLQTIIENAIKYQKPNVSLKINITTKSIDNKYLIIIEDNGIGIKKENQTKIFEKLYRVPSGNIHNVKGFGLGLSYAKMIMEKHQGLIEVESIYGKGSNFILQFQKI